MNSVKDVLGMDGLIYLATPYSEKRSGIREQRFRYVNRAAAWMMAQGMLIFSPISHTHPIALAGRLPTGFDYWEKYDRAILSVCNGMVVFMQDGWRESKGVTAEINIAGEYDLPINYLTYEDIKPIGETK